MEHAQPRQKVEARCLLRDRVCGRDRRLRRDDRRARGEHHHREQQRLGREEVKRIAGGGRIAQHERTLPEVVQRKRGEHQAVPGEPDRHFPEMAHVGIKRLRAGHAQEHGAEREQRERRLLGDEAQRVQRVQRGEHGRRL